jgi:hypothetical protein
MQLSGQEYVDIYAAKMKLRLRNASGDRTFGSEASGRSGRSRRKGIRAADAVGATSADRLPVERAG